MDPELTRELLKDILWALLYSALCTLVIFGIPMLFNGLNLDLTAWMLEVIMSMENKVCLKEAVSLNDCKT